MLKKVLIGLVAVIAVLVVVIALQPADYHVERTAEVKAPASVLFAFGNDLKEMNKWSPWRDLDPKMEMTYKGPESGKGQGYHWKGNDDVGEGEMTIVSTVPDKNVTYELKFILPFEATCASEYKLAAKDETTTSVTWTLDGTNNFMAKAMGLFMNMDEMIGKDYEKGLAKLTTVAEAKWAEDQKAAAEKEAAEKAAAEAAATEGAETDEAKKEG